MLYALDAKVDSVISLAHTVAEEGEGWFAELAQRPPVKSAVAAYQRAHDIVVATTVYSKCDPCRPSSPPASLHRNCAMGSSQEISQACRGWTRPQTSACSMRGWALD